MELLLEVLDGDRATDRIPLRDGLVIGRQGVDVNLIDPKVSARHCEIKIHENGDQWLMDLGSNNGIRLPNGKKVRKLKLTPGTAFRLGNTHFVVISKADLSQSTQPEIVLDDDQTPTETWRNVVRRLIARSVDEARAKPKPTQVFENLLHLQIVQGPQAGEVWTLGYGPRDIGSGSIDLQIEDSTLPTYCFSLTPHDYGTLLKIDPKAMNITTVNGKVVESAYVENGDVIQVGNTQIKIHVEAGGGS